MPRPQKQPAEKRDMRVAFRLSAADAAALGSKAKDAGLSLSAYARQMALKGRVAVVRREAPDFAAIDQLRRIGVNLNQLTRAYHRRDADEPDYLRELCRQIEQVLDRAITGEGIR